MEVVVIDEKGVLITRGEWDGVRRDGEFARINGDYFHVAYVYHAEHENVVRATLTDAHKQVKLAEDLKMKALMEMGNLYRARPK